MTSPSLSHPFPDGLKTGALYYQRCSSCSAPQTLKRYACHQCGSNRLVWTESAGSGRIYAFTTIARAPSDAFRALVPYTLALVDLDEGFRLMGHTVSSISIGDRVRATYFAHENRQLVRFLQCSDD